MDEAEHLIVGSGLSALVFGALAASAGQRVRMLEAHDAPGGYGHSFDAGGYRFNAQLHYVWNTAPDRTVGRVLARLGLGESVPFVPLDPMGYDHMRLPGLSLDVPCALPLLAQRVKALFPGHGAALDRFFDILRWTDEGLEALPLRGVAPARGLLHVLRYRDATLQQVFDGAGVPPEAQALLALQWPDFLLPPAELSFLAWVKLIGGYARGATYPRGHFHAVVDALVGVIRAGGGEVLTGRRVTRFLEREGRIVGVEAEVLDAAGAPTGEVAAYEGRQVICNMDPKAAAERIGLARFPAAVRRRLAYRYSPSSFVAYCGVKGVDLGAHGFGAWNVFHADAPDLNALFGAMYDRGDYARVSFAVSTPTRVSAAPGIAPPGHDVLQLVTVADHSRFSEAQRHSPRAYRAQKQRVLDAMLDVLERDYVPGLRDALTVCLTGSPTTNERFVWAPAGNSYGAAMTPRQVSRARLDHRSGIPGLWFCNASAGFAGMAGTFWTGARLFETLSGESVLA